MRALWACSGCPAPGSVDHSQTHPRLVLQVQSLVMNRCVGYLTNDKYDTIYTFCFSETGATKVSTLMDISMGKYLGFKLTPDDPDYEGTFAFTGGSPCTIDGETIDAYSTIALKCSSTASLTLVTQGASPALCVKRSEHAVGMRWARMHERLGLVSISAAGARAPCIRS